ncbi:esterase-like activity of phytase family protein [Flavobacterium taihuense]|uniref:Esterase-like activity of phytase family protein n=1 Tax=Flavobacterium taihuense TaxID=2857508 RepID=A0ABS6XYB5_9FLAO|nr:esterase-like activity of phytase family protein [Flavobacterium taihuense]MBW4361584.1 esterase-like activity of phytase family protein [Flavobacterium taihuense]
MKNCVSFVIVFILIACQHGSEALTKLYSLPKKLKEVSGIVFTEKGNLFWTLEDSGNANKIYGLNANNGDVEKAITIENTLNIDWEDITKDAAGNLYIGDFGNNDNVRKDLCIYKINKNSLNQENAIPAYKISFSYPEQKEFPPKKTKLFFDVEGFFEIKNNFYLFTKNRSKGFDGTVLVYKVPNKGGFHQAVLMGKLKTCDNYNHCALTSATISPDASKVVLLTHDKIVILENFKGDNFLKGTQTAFKLDHFSQKEAICFKNNETLIIADEKTNKIGGNVYQVNLNALKSIP